jgi:hypothetical protein
MSKLAAAVATLLLVVAAACGSSPLTDPVETPSTITFLSPGSGPAGALVTVHGSGFKATDNTVNFAASALDDPTQLPNEPSVIPDLRSADGTTVVFTVPSFWRPACSYSPTAPCPFANIPTARGTYSVSVSNSSGTSNAVSFVVTR